MNLGERIAQAYAEDIPNGDLTTEILNLDLKVGDAHLVAKEDLVLSGQDIFDQCLQFAAPDCKPVWQFSDSDLVLKQQTLCWIKGDFAQLLKAERVALNFLGHLSGIATLTRCFAQEARGTKCKILDTRKTTPLLRDLEKKAVVHGGGANHRMNLSAAVLIKENHIRAAGSITTALRLAKKNYLGEIEVECSTLAEVLDAVKGQAHRILLDNMDNEQIREARKVIPSTIRVEASGNMSLDRIASVAALGVDFISVGALTHSAPCADFSLLFD